MKKILLFYTCFLVLFLTGASAEEKLIQVKGLVHLNSNVSSGEYSPEKLVKMAREAGINAVFLTENLKPKWEYGVFPFRNIIKRTVEKNGLLKYGVKKYNERIKAINENNPNMTVLMAAEVAPFYYWTGRPFRDKGLTLHDWDLQFFVTGLEAHDYESIPTLSSGSFSCYSWASIMMLWPVAFVIIGIISLKKKHPRFYLTDTLCWVLILAGVLFTLSNYPFKVVKFDQYHGSAGPGPYQEVINYINSKDGMVFWSNPEAKTNKTIGPVEFVSPAATKYMMETADYTGFCCFYEGYRDIGGPGGVWDILLTDYCTGKKEKPVWAIGEMAYHGSRASGGKEIDEVQTVFLVPSNSSRNILKAMKAGNMYAVRRSKEHRLQLESFAVEYEEGSKAGMGKELMARSPITVHFSLNWEGEPEDVITAKLIRGGKVIKEFTAAEPGEYTYNDSFYEPGQKTYYRLDIRAKYPGMLFSNPIFVKFK